MTEQKGRIWPYFLFLAEAAAIGIFQTLANTDKLWNYMFASNMASGLLPYRDFNLLQTPFSPLVNAVFLAIFGHKMLVFELLGSLLFTLIAACLYQLCRLYGHSVLSSLILPNVFLLLFFWNVFFEYSCLIVLMQLLLMGLDLRAVRHAGSKTGDGSLSWSSAQDGEPSPVLEPSPAFTAWQRPVVQVLFGLCGGFAMMSKQTFGLFVAAASFLSLFLLVFVFAETKRDTRTAIRLLAARAIGILIPNFIFLFYLLGTGTFGDFWDMAIAGVSTFTSSYSYIALAKENIGCLLACIGMPLLILLSAVLAVTRRGTSQSHALTIVLLYGTFGLINMYPMANTYHFSTCVIPYLILFAILLPPSLLEHPVLSFVIQTVAMAAAIYLILYVPIDIVRKNDLCTEPGPFQGVFWDEKTRDEIHEITGFVRKKEEAGYTVYILDNRAGLFFLPLEEYHKYFDMFLVGNLGTTPPEELLENAAVEGSLFLVPTSERGQWQYPYDAVRKLTKEWADQGESIGDFVCWYGNITE